MAKKDIVCPLEEVESSIFANWLRLNNLEDAGHVPNETRTPYRGELAKLKRMGVSKGIPDFLVVIPASRCTEGRALLLFVEMKRQNGVPSDVKPEQKRWLAALDQVADVGTFVAFGAEEACKYVAQYLTDAKMFQF